ncbi:DUF2280 domain-containing protein [Bradyrhizobium sp. HKCCYLS2038]|uniref:DUF2280 domain-containing protein n=1 Tax=Bradyrhizobium sp. HKCCYLS2038 TaxID=3420764 RepID=UPI003EB6C235
MANVHTKPQQEFIVRKLAAFEPPRSIVLDFAAVYPDTKCDENDVLRLDPSNGVSPELFMLFKQTREAVLLDPESAPFAAQQARLIALSHDVKFHRARNELANARAVLRQIAEELGAVGGGKGAGKAVPSAGETPEFKQIEVTRTVVDPPPMVAEQ